MAVAFLLVTLTLVWVDLFVDLIGRDISRPITYSWVLVWIMLNAAYFRPKWFRILGRPDPTAQPRFLLTWFRGQWNRLDDDRRRMGFAEMFEGELEKIRDPANAGFIDSWIGSLQAFVHAGRLGKTSVERGRVVLDKRLDGVVPVDPIARWI